MDVIIVGIHDDEDMWMMSRDLDTYICTGCTARPDRNELNESVCLEKEGRIAKKRGG